MLPALRPIADERRKHQRVKVSLLGRYMLSDRQEYPCQTVNMSPGGMALVAPVVGQPGERVVVYLDQIGRVEGVIVRHIPNGFAMTVAATPRKRDKLADQLTWLANRHTLGLPEDRRHERVVPRISRSVLKLPDGHEHPCRVLDISLSGAAVQADIQPPVGTQLMLGRNPARVVRHLDKGLALEFIRPQSLSDIEEQLI